MSGPSMGGGMRRPPTSQQGGGAHFGPGRPGQGRRPGGMGPGGMMMGGLPPEKSKDFGKSFRRLLGQPRPERTRVLVVLVLAIGSVAFSVIGPKILGNATNIIFEGFIGKQLPQNRGLLVYFLREVGLAQHAANSTLFLEDTTDVVR